jgi:biopolymer transport protein ExbD
MKLTSRSARHGARVELQMTSMIDVVFLLLIFFMVTSSFNKTERQLDPAIKSERAGSSQAESNLEPAIIEIVRGGEGFVYRLGGRDIAQRDELVSVLSQFPNKQDGAFVRGSDDAPIDMAAAAIQACKQARFLLVTYEAMPHQP